MPEAKTKDRISTSGNVLNLSDQHSTKGVDASTYFMVVPNNRATENSSSSNPDSPLNLVMNTNHSSETMRLKSAPVAATAKIPFAASKFTTDISFTDSMTVPTHPANKANYFPKTVPNFQGMPVSGHFLQRIGPFHYNAASSGTPLVAFVNPNPTTSVIPHGLKPVFTAQSSIPSVETMNQIVYTSMSSAKPNMTQHMPTPVLLVRSSAPLSKHGNFQYVMAPTEKTSMTFPKSSPQAIFGNESGKFIPVATIVPNNASLVTNSTKTVTSALPVEPTLSTDSKYQQQNGVKMATHSYSVGSKSTSNSLNPPWFPNVNGHSMVLQHSSTENMYNTKDSCFSMSQPLNLTLQSVSGYNRKPNNKNAQFIDLTCKQKYTSVNPSLSHKLFFHSSSASSSPIIINSAAYSLPNQNVTLTTPPHVNLQKGFSSHPAFGNDTTNLNSKSYAESYKGRSTNLLNFSSLPPMTTQIPEKNGHTMLYEEPSMNLKIDSIFSLADKPDAKPVPRPVNKQKQPQKIKMKKTTKLINKDKKKVIVKKPETKLSKPRSRQPQKSVKHPVKERLKPKYKRTNTQLEIAHSILKRKVPAQKSNIIVSCYANDFKSLHPISEEERKLNTFFKYLGLCPSSSLTSNGAINNNGGHVGQGGSANGQCNVSKELARCFSCYVVVPMFKAPKSFTVMDINDPPESFNIQDKCSKECRHAFLNKQHATTGIVPRNGELDSCWKIILQKPTCPHARKKYCRKSKTKASGNFTGSHCRRVGCIGCTTKKPTTHNKMKYFRKNSKDNTTATSSSVDKEQTFSHHKQGGRKLYTFNKKSIHNPNKDMNIKKESPETDNTSVTVLGENSLPALRKRKANQRRYRGAKVLKKNVTVESENVMGNGDVIESESVDEISPFESSFLEIEDSGRTEDTLMFAANVMKPEPIVLPPADISASSERIQRLKEILKEKQKDLERQLLLLKQVNNPF